MKVEVSLKQGSDYSHGLYDGKGITVYTGSYISNRVMSSTFKQAEVRKELISKYTQERNGKLFLMQDVVFTSPSAAAGFCTGTSANGHRKSKFTQEYLAIQREMKRLGLKKR